MVAYRTAYLKYFYPKEFLAGILNDRLDKIEEISKYIAYMKERGIAVLQPDINRSRTIFAVEGDGLRIGLGALRGIGIEAIEAVINERNEHGQFADFADFAVRCAKYINKRIVESLIYAGAFDCFNHPRAVFAAVYEDVLSRVTAMDKQKSGAQISLFGNIIEEEKITIDYPDIPEYDQTEKLSLEKSVLGVYVSGHPFEKFAPYFKDKTFNCSMMQYEEDEDTGERKYTEIASGQSATMGGMISAYKKLQTKSGLFMAFVTVEDLYGTVECVCFPKVYDKIKSFLAEDRVVTLSGKIDISDEKPPVIIVDRMNEFTPPEEKSPSAANSVSGNNGGNNTAGGAGGGTGNAVQGGAYAEEKDDSEKTLWLNITGLDERDLGELTDTLAFYQGNTSVIFVDKIKRAKYMCSQKVSISRALYAELSTCLSEDKIKLL